MNFSVMLTRLPKQPKNRSPDLSLCGKPAGPHRKIPHSRSRLSPRQL